MQDQGRPEGTPGGEPRPLFGGDTTGGRSTGGYAAGDASVGGTMSAQDEQTWSMVSHLTVLAALIGLMPLGALAVWLIYKDKSPRVRFHSLQALWYQLAWLVILVAYAIVTVILSIVTLGIATFLLVPLGIVLGIAPVAHGCYAAYKVSQGEDYRYPFVADRIGGGTGRVV
jgi:uncharacterized protein